MSPIARILFALVLLVPTRFAHAAGSGSVEPPPREPLAGREDPAAHFAQGQQALEAKNYRVALDHFEQAVRGDRKNPDYLNMLAYTQRKLGKLEDAFKNYASALDRREKFPQAREYLGEAHIQAALEQLAKLQSYGPEGEKELKMLIEAFQRAAASINADGSLKGASASDW